MEKTNVTPNTEVELTEQDFNDTLTAYKQAELDRIIAEDLKRIERLEKAEAEHEDQLEEYYQNIRETIEMYKDVVAVVPNYSDLEEVPEWLQLTAQEAMDFREEALNGEFSEDDLSVWWGDVGLLELYGVVTLVRRGDVEYTTEPIETDSRKLLVTKASC